MDTAAALLALILAGDHAGADLLAAEHHIDPVDVAQAARFLVADLAVTVNGPDRFTLADAVDAARVQARLMA